MATVKVVDLINRAQIILQDTTGTRWPVCELLAWLNDSYREIALARPDVNTLSGTFTCAAGTRQVLTDRFPEALRVIDVVRNVASTSNKRAVRMIDRRILDDQRRGWHAETATTDIQHWMYDPRLPREFMVYPPASSAAQLEVLYSAVPVAHTLTEAELTGTGECTTQSSETIHVVDAFANAMLDYMLYRAYSKDADYAANAARAVAHLQAMQGALGTATTSDSAVTSALVPGATTVR